MKIKLLIILNLTHFLYEAQNIAMDRVLHNKYWNIRSRLRNDFMKVGPNPGESIPLEQRGYNYYPNNISDGPFIFPYDPNTLTYKWGQQAKWGDALGEIGYYIGVLATEHALLALNSQPTQEAIRELYFALGALNRVDLQAEINFNLASGFPSQSTLNGFMLRDDVPSTFITNNIQHFNYYGNKGFKSKIYINSLNESAGSSSTQQNSIGGNYISIDHAVNVLVGLALVARFVPPDVTYNNQNVYGGDPASLHDAAIAIGDRIYNYMKNGFSSTSISWNLEYPDGTDISNEWGGQAMPNCYAFAETLNKMVNSDWGYKTYGHTAHFNNECDWSNWVNDGETKFQRWWRENVATPAEAIAYGIYPHFSGPYNHPSLAYENLFDGQLLQTWLGSQDLALQAVNLSAIANCIYTYKGNKTKSHQVPRIAQRDFYHGDLLRMAIHGWGNCADNSMSSASLSQAYSIMQQAPCEGSFNYFQPNSNVGLVGPAAPSAEWSTTSRLDHPDRRGNNNIIIGEFNSLDYMLYHNLYYLVQQQSNPQHEGWKIVDLTQRQLQINYPTTIKGTPWGSTSYPAFVPSHEYITANNKINVNAKVTYQAGKSIELKTGFSSEYGSTFESKIFNDPNFCAYNSDFSNPYDLGVNGRQSSSNAQNNFSNEPTIFVKQENLIKKNKGKYNDSTNSINEKLLPASNSSISNPLIIKIYPNPSDGLVNIFVNEPTNYASLRIINIMGQVVFQSTEITDINVINLNTQPKGVFMAELNLKNGLVVAKKIIIN